MNAAPGTRTQGQSHKLTAFIFWPHPIEFLLNTLVWYLFDMQKANLTLSATSERVTKHTFDKFKDYITEFLDALMGGCFNLFGGQSGLCSLIKHV